MSIYTYKARAIKIVDGDTFDAEVSLGFDFYLNQRIRLYGIDAFETRSKDKKEKERGLKAKERLIELIENEDLTIESIEWGKYGRCVAKVYKVGFLETVNDILVSEGHAVYKEY